MTRPAVRFLIFIVPPPLNLPRSHPLADWRRRLQVDRPNRGPITIFIFRKTRQNRQMIAGSNGAESDRRSQAMHVEFEGVSKSYDGRTLVVDDLNLGIGKGEFVTLLGPSGSGKTTILMMLAGFQPATSGAIRIGGRSVQDLPPRKRGIGMVFQNYALFPHMTVGANLAFSAGSARDCRGSAPRARHACARSRPPRRPRGPAAGPAFGRPGSSAWPSPALSCSNPNSC